MSSVSCCEINILSLCSLMSIVGYLASQSGTKISLGLCAKPFILTLVTQRVPYLRNITNSDLNPSSSYHLKAILHNFCIERCILKKFLFPSAVHSLIFSFLNQTLGTLNCGLHQDDPPMIFFFYHSALTLNHYQLYIEWSLLLLRHQKCQFTFGLNLQL